MTFAKNRPVVFWTLITGVAESIIGLLLIFETVTWTGAETGAVMLVLAAIGAMFTFITQGLVTPTANPRDDAGNPLTPGPISSDNADDLPPI